MVISNGVSLFAEAKADSCHVIYQNVDFYVHGSGLTGTAGSLYNTLTCLASFYGCSAEVDLSASASLLGGWIGNIDGGNLVMSGCTTYGTIESSGTYAAGFLGQSAKGLVRFTDCINLANITAVSYAAGITGNVGTGTSATFYTNCINYGNITATGSGYGNMAGGIQGRATNNADEANHRLRVFYNCVNYGTVTAGGRAGGMVGSSHDYDTGGPDANYNYYTFENCVNYGNVNGGDYAGGIMGAASPVTYRAEITDCVNVGKITSDSGYAGNFAGMLSSGVITGGYAAGVVASAMGDDVLVPHNEGGYTLQAGTTYKGATWPIIPYVASGVGYIGAAETVGEGITKITEEAMAEALAGMGALCNKSFLAADASDSDSYVVAAEPILRGVQQGAAATSGYTDLRFVAGINALDAYETVGFHLVLHANGKTIELLEETDTVYTSLNALSANGTLSEVTAAETGNKYLCAVAIRNVPISADVRIEVTPYAVTYDGVKYKGNTRVISCEDSAFRIEPMMLNDRPLSAACRHNDSGSESTSPTSG